MPPDPGDAVADEPAPIFDRKRHWELSPEKGAMGAWVQKRRLADAMRTVIDRLVQSNAPEDELRAAADALERYAEQLEGHERLRRYEGFGEAANAGDVGAFFDQSPMIGLANPLAPPVRLEDVDDTSAVGRVTFGAAYEGPPGSVHGGFVAAAFDEVLGYVQSMSGAPGFTGTLTIRYRSPTPLHTELEFRCVLGRTEGRKTFAGGQLYAGERLCAEAEAIFVSATAETFLALLEERRRMAAERDA
jgi:acyl-coenzyme A thioesterase PaaI-like protein